MTVENLPRLEAALDLMSKRVAAVGPGQWGDPTPCEGWTVRNLLSHAVNTNRIFAGSVDGLRLERGTPEVDVMGDDPIAAWEDSVAVVRRAYAAPDLATREVEATFGPTTGSILVAVHFFDIVVHSWDLARATGQDATLPAELADTALAIARLFPETPQYRGDAAGAAFRPAIPVGDDASATDRLMAFLGRRP